MVTDESILRDAHARVRTARGVRSYAEFNCKKRMYEVYFLRISGIVTSDWLQHTRSVRGVYE